MNGKEELVYALLKKKLLTTKVGLLINGIHDICPVNIVTELVKTIDNHLYICVVGDTAEPNVQDKYTISNTIEKAVLWRSMPECAGKIIAFVEEDTDKLHSLAEFDVITMRDLTHYLIQKQIEKDSNIPTRTFWTALQDTADYYFLEDIIEFVSSVCNDADTTLAISKNMWKLNLLCDHNILGTKYKPEERLKKNRELIIAIGQLSEDSRKKLSRALSKAKDSDKDRLQRAYRELQRFFKYGKKENLKELDFDTVQELFAATKSTSVQKAKNEGTNIENSGINDESPVTPIVPKELDNIIAKAVVEGNNEEKENAKELLEELKNHFDSSSDDNTPIQTIGGIFQDRPITLENHQKGLRRIVGKACTGETWGGILTTDESVLKDAITADIEFFDGFKPQIDESRVSFDGVSLFEFMRRFDSLFKDKKLDITESFGPQIDKLIELREKLCSKLDLIMYYPALAFGCDEELRHQLIDYVETWRNIYHCYCVNDPAMREISNEGTNFIARALLLLDVLYIKTPTEWKAILLPLHPMYLWRYYEIFRKMTKEPREDDAEALTKVLNQLPQVLNFLIVDKMLTETTDAVLPCSGNIEVLPTFENRTNRYLGDDGTKSIAEILTRWIGFAPYTKNEVRICSVDAPDLTGNIRSIKEFMDKNSCNRVVYDVYLTRKQNGNTELSKLDYSGKDYGIEEYIKQERIAISIHNVASAKEVKDALAVKPVHVAFYFDQSSYSIEYGPSNQSLYINPLVITYDYEYDEATHRGTIYPSSDMGSGLIGDYYKIMKSVDLISLNMNPRTTYNSNADMSEVISTIEGGETQWLVIADRDTNNYVPQGSIQIGEMQYDKRMVCVWASRDSRIIAQYLDMLKRYNLYPKKENLLEILSNFGHIAANGLISIPRYGSDSQAIENKKKGLLGTLFAAVWYTQHKPDALVASLDTEKARLWLHNSEFGNERADLVGLWYDEESNTLHIQPIEVKTRDEAPDAVFTPDASGGCMQITGHAASQIASVVNMLNEIFSLTNQESLDMFISARREVLKYQIVSECFRNSHNDEQKWQKKWSIILKKAFGNGKPGLINISVSGMLMYFKLSETVGGKVENCVHPDFDNCPIEFRQMTAREIQEDIFKEGSPFKTSPTLDFDNSEEVGTNDLDAPIDLDLPKVATTTECESENIVDRLEVTSGLNIHSETRNDANGNTNIYTTSKNHVSKEEIEQLAKDFKRSCADYHINLRECEVQNVVVGPSVIRFKFKLARGQALQGLLNHLEDISREMKRSGVIIQSMHNSDDLLLDVPRLVREKVLFKNVMSIIPKITSPEQLFFPLGRTPDGRDLIEDLSLMPHMLVGGSTGSGKSVLLFTILASLLMTHPKKEDMQLVLSSSKLEDFIHFDGLPHLYSGKIISDATEATQVIKDVIFTESERRGKLLADARVANIIEYNKKEEEKLAPIVVVIDEFADLADQLETKKEQNAFYKPIQRIAQAGRSRGIHLILCTQRPEAKLVPSTTKAQLNARVALRVNDGISSHMIIETSDAQYLQKHGDMIYKNGDTVERAQGYLIEISELDEIIENVKNGKYL